MPLLTLGPALALLVAVGLFSGKLAALPSAGRWTLWTKRAGGVLLLLMAESTSSGWAVFYE
ncbi:MAG TPA: hypothetical protein VJ808_10580 [Gemmatimonadales bacterium]|nr:hypothetical protein [Gemmatimonadales bacterium]